MPEGWRRKLRALGGLEPDATRLRDRALHGPRLPDPQPGPGRTVVAGAVAIALAVGSFGLLRTTFGDGGPASDDPSVSASPDVSSSPEPSALDPDAICEVPDFDPDVALLGDATSSVFGSPGPREVALEALNAPGEPASTIGGVAADSLRAYLEDPQARNAPSHGWRLIAESADEVVFAAPPEGGYSDWWVVRFTLTDGDWRPRETELLDQHQTPAQLGRGLRLTWGETTVVDDGVWGSTLELANDRGASWSSGDDGNELWGVAHVFDPETGGEVGHAARTVGRWGVETTVASGETVRLPLSLGGALTALGPGHEYDVVACSPELGLASPVGTLRVAELPMASARVLTYPFEGLSMLALGGGRLVVHNGCLAVESSSTDRRPTYVLWPDGTALVFRDGEVPVLIDAVGTEIARLGDDVTLGGGYVPPDSAETATIGGLPEACRSGGDGYFVTGGLADAG
jgi:hypothetical protein